MVLFQDYTAYLIELAFKEDATAYELLTITFAFGVFWGVLFAIIRPILKSLTHDKPWLISACEREYERAAKDMYESFGIDITKEKAVEGMMEDWAGTQVMTIQHLSGAMLCVPSLIGMGDPEWASSLAICGILSEVGFEIESSLELAYKRLFTKDGAKKVTNGIIIILLLHHSLSTGMAIPMALNYRNMRALHWLGFELQFGAAAVSLTEYSKLLDITIPNHLRQFKLINFVLLVLMVWTRAIHWLYLSFEMIMTWYHDKAWGFMAVGAVLITAFSLFNAFLCVIPTYKRFTKFLHKSAEYESLPADVSEKMRRQSTVRLQDAVGELLLEESLGMEDRISMFLDSFDRKGKVERRRTMPPRASSKSTWGSTRLMKMKFASVSADANVWKDE